MTRISEYLGKSVSHGTLRDVDLYNAFIEVYADLNTVEAQAFIHSYHVEVGQVLLAAAMETPVDPKYAEAITDMISELQDKLDALAPGGWTFSSTEGDGSDFGFWQVTENLDEEDLDPNPEVLICGPCGRGTHAGDEVKKGKCDCCGQAV